jgi:hypothetical protein
VRDSFQGALRRLTRVTRPIALRSAGKVGSNTSVIHHLGRRSGQTYETPVVAVQHQDCFLVALRSRRRRPTSDPKSSASSGDSGSSQRCGCVEPESGASFPSRYAPALGGAGSALAPHRV